MEGRAEVSGRLLTVSTAALTLEGPAGRTRDVPFRFFGALKTPLRPEEFWFEALAVLSVAIGVQKIRRHQVLGRDRACVADRERSFLDGSREWLPNVDHGEAPLAGVAEFFLNRHAVRQPLTGVLDRRFQTYDRNRRVFRK